MGEEGSRFLLVFVLVCVFFSIGTEDHATDNNQPIVWQQKRHN